MDEDIKILDEKQAELRPIHSNHGRWLLSWCYYERYNGEFKYYLHSQYFRYKKDADKFIEENDLKLVEGNGKCQK